MKPLDIDLIVQRLAEPEFGLQQVLSAAEYAAVQRIGDFRAGAAYVVLADESNPAGTSPQAMMKTAANATFGVIVATRNYRDGAGAAAKDDVRTLVGNVRKALMGWAPTGCRPCVWQRGEVLDYDAGVLLWLDVYSTSHVLGGAKS